MSQLWSPFAYDVGGAPHAAAATPELRAYGQLTAVQAAAAQDVFARFCQTARNSMVPNPTEWGNLPDGTPYRIDRIGVQTIMQVWPAAPAKAQTAGGIVVFYWGVGGYIISGKDGWKARKVSRSFSALNFYRTPGGKYFCDSARPLVGNTGNYSTSKMVGQVLSNTLYGSESVAVVPDGYLFWEKKRRIAAMDDAGKFIFLEMNGNQYALTQPVTAPTAADPASSEKVVPVQQLASGEAFPADYRFSGFHRTQSEFIVVGSTQEESWLKRSVMKSVISRQPPYAKVTQAFAVSSGRIEEVFTELHRGRDQYQVVWKGSKTTRFEAPPASDPQHDWYTYAGFPITATACLVFALASEFETVKRARSYAKERQWWGIGVDISGRPYDVELDIEDVLEHQDTYISRSWGVRTTAPNFSSRVWQLEPLFVGAPSPARTVYELPGPEPSSDTPQPEAGDYGKSTQRVTFSRKFITTLRADGYELPLAQVDFSVVLHVFGGAQQPSVLQGQYLLRGLAGFDEKLQISVVDEEEFEDLSIRDSQIRNIREAYVRFTRVRRMVVYLRDRRIYARETSREAGSMTFELYQIALSKTPQQVGEQRADIDFGAIAVVGKTAEYERDASGNMLRKGTYTAAAAPIVRAPISFAVFQADDFVQGLGPSSYGIRMLEPQLSPDLRGLEGYQFTHDPVSGGCLIASSGGVPSLLVTPAGAVTQLSAVTGQADSALARHKGSI